ncbi:MAG TPA: hypothetical protein VF746_09195 [Longimicrobium sp.]|jgi:hypothetical protein
MNTRHAAMLAPMLTILATFPLGAQEGCSVAPADTVPMRIALTLPGPPERAAELVARALRDQEYRVPEPPRGAGTWAAAPRHTWPRGMETAPWHREQHPGVQVSGEIRPRGDSSEVTLAARTLCDLRPEDARLPTSAESMTERMSALELLTALVRRAGPDRRLVRLRLDMPPQLGALALAGAHEYPDPSLGTQLRYRGPDRVDADVYVYPGPPAFARCTPSCGEAQVLKELADFMLALPALTRARHGEQSILNLRETEVLRPDSADRWVAGRHQTWAVRSQVLNNQVLDSHIYLAAYPGYMLKVRSTFPGTPERTAALRAFMDELLDAVGRAVPAPPPAPPPPARASLR